ncbi:MAG: hypothetical protein QME71_08590 [Dehalococcoidia bacterium]|nr:hypothetical protein [Dehalococcoidia bacterium]
MPVLTDFPMKLDAGPALERLGAGAWQRIVDEAMREAEELISPAIAYAVHPVVGVEESRLIVDGGAALESAVVASLFGSAPEVVPMIFTIGPRLEERVAEYGRANDFPASFALDVIGSIAVTQVGAVGYELIEGLARERGVKASIPLNPGTSHWPMSGQRVIAGLVPAAEIGVEVLPSDILRPFKSIAFVVALGTDVLTPAEGSSCDYCERRDLCRG